MERLMALRPGLAGNHTLEGIAQAVGRARSRAGAWMKVAREEGVAALLARHQGRGRAPRVTGKAEALPAGHPQRHRAPRVTGKAPAGPRHGLVRGRWTRARDAAEWLQERHGITLSEAGTRYWLKKAGES